MSRINEAFHSMQQLPSAHSPLVASTKTSQTPRRDFLKTDAAMSSEPAWSDDLVGWAWDRDAGRTLPPFSRADTGTQLKIWIDGRAACPQ